MKTEVVLVTPELAHKWLERNTDNRHLRQTVVDGLAVSMCRGEWMLTHQGIAFSPSGRLIDGQHRLHAVIAANMKIRMMVTWGADEETFKAVDIGVKRSASDVLGITRAESTLARFLATIEDTTLRAGVTPQFMIPFVEATRAPLAELLDYCPSKRKAWASGAIHAAAVLRMLDGEDRDYIKLVYHALVHLEFDSMPPVAQALFRQHSSGAVKANGNDFFARALKVFTRKNASMKTIQISAIDTSLAYAREVISREIRGQGSKKNAAGSGGKRPVKSSRDYSAA